MKNTYMFVKSIFTVTGAWIGSTMDLLIPTLLFLIVLMIVDYISGMLASKREALEHPEQTQYRWSSRKSIIGIYKKVGYILTILVAVSTDFVIYKYANEIGLQYDSNTMFGLLVSVWFIINELLSILENISRMGVKLPNSLTRVLLTFRNNLDKDK